MRKLTFNEMEAVRGGNPVAVIAVGGVVLAAAAVGVVAYAAYKGCNATMSAGKDGVELEVQCKKYQQLCLIFERPCWALEE